jgi:hypothetical protein
MNEHSFVRAETLAFGSIEFFALVAIAVYAVFKYKGNLIPTYILFIPFTDKVYRIGDLQIADILALLILAKAAINFRIKFNRYTVLLGGILLGGSVVAMLFHKDIFALAYSIRVFSIALVAMVIAEKLKDSDQLVLIVRKAYKFIVVFSVCVGLFQAVLWSLGLPIDGVFYTHYIRVKGLGHEPSTFGIWLALSLPLILRDNKHSNYTQYDWPLFGVIMLGMVLTSSSSAIITFLIIGTLMIFVNNKITKVQKILVAGIASVFLVATTAIFNEIVYDNVVLKAGTYFLELADSTLEDTSGRGGDRYLFLLLSESPNTGIGLFRSSRAAEIFAEYGVDLYIPGSNFYLTTYAEFGVIFGPVVLLLIFAWFVWTFHTILKTRSMWGCSIVGWFFALAAMRIFGFHQPWLNYALFMAKR